jgi:hypothetical protein
MEAFLKVYGETSGPIVDTIKSVEELFNNVKTIQERVNTKIADVSSKMDQIQNIGLADVAARRGGKKTKTIKRNRNKHLK